MGAPNTFKPGRVSCVRYAEVALQEAVRGKRAGEEFLPINLIVKLYKKLAAEK